MMQKLLKSTLLLLIAATAPVLQSETIELKPENWTFTGKNISLDEYKGRECVHFKGKGGREAYVTDYEFSDGEIRLKMAGSMFVGCLFRVQDASTYEAVYFRPENSHHKKAIKRGHTVQYIAHPDNPWHHLREKYPEKYESGADIPVDEWFDVRLVVEGKRLEVFVNDDTEPCLVVEELLNGDSSGSVGFYTDAGREGWFSDLQIESK